MSNAEKKCPRCAETVKAEAYVCRFCGLNFAAGFKAPEPAQPKPKFSWFHAIGTAVGLILIGKMVGCGSAPTVSADAVQTMPEPRRASIKELFDAYEANEMHAQQEYGAQPVIVSGTVRDIDLDLIDDPIVTLEDGEYELNAFFDKKNGGAATAELVKGQIASVQCAEIGEVLGSPVIRQCQIIAASK